MRVRTPEEELARAIGRYEWVLAHVADGIYGLDARGRVEFVNPSAVRITGHPESQQRGADQHALIHARRADGSPYPREECPVHRALRSGRTVVADDEVFWRSDGTPVPVELVAVPTVEGGSVTGVIVSFRDLTERRAAAAQAAQLDRLALEAAASRALADRLQQALLTPPPEPDHLHVAVRYLPAGPGAQVGGDWYDAFLQPSGTTMLVIGDVVGHDTEAAAAMGQLRSLLRGVATYSDAAPVEVLRGLDASMATLQVGTLATAAVARFEQTPGELERGITRMRWANAGHLPPLVVNPDGSVAELAPWIGDLMLGVDASAQRRESLVTLDRGSTVLLYTDGLVERRDADLDQGLHRLRTALTQLADLPLEELLDELLERLVQGRPDDDVALVAVRLHPLPDGAGS